MSNSKRKIIKATGIVGGAQVISIIIRIVRTKIIAVLLGPAGVGIAGLYQSTLDIVRSATGLGLDFSAVRDVAEANGSGDQQRIGRTITILRRWVWLTGLLGVALLLLFREQFSRYAFKDTEHTFDFMMLAIVPLFTAISGGQLALLRGIRRIGDMARAGVLGATAGLCITVPLYWLMGVNGIVPAMVLSALAELGLSWYFAQKTKVQSVKINLRETMTGGAGMVRLGLFTIITGLAATGTMYLVRILIANKMGVDSVGQFQAAWNISAIYVGLVLGAMSADYFPRLSAINQDNVQVCKLVNEQTEIALLLAGPLIVGMLCFLDIIIKIFYSNKFGQSSTILLWQMAGNLLKVISWPMGFILLAKARGAIFVFTELCWNGIYFCLVYFGWKALGLEITGVAFLISYLILLAIICGITYRLCGFFWSKKSLRYIAVYGCLILLAFFNSIYMPDIKVYFVGGVLSVITAGYSYYELRKIVDIKTVFNRLIRR